MIGVRIELKAVNGCFFLEPLYDFISSVINDVNSALLSSWDYVISPARESVDVVEMYVFDLVLKHSNSQVPDSDLLVLPTAKTYLIVLERDVLDTVMALEDEQWLYNVTLCNWSKLPFWAWRTFDVKQLEFISWGTDQSWQWGSKPKCVIMNRRRKRL